MDQSENRPARYRSTRQTNSRVTSPVITTHATNADNNEATTVSRNPSRYHRKEQHLPSPLEQPLPSPLVGPGPISPGPGVERIARPQDAFAMSSREYLVSPEAPVPGDRVLSPRAEAERRARLDRNYAARLSEAGNVPDRQTSRLPDRSSRQDSPFLDKSSSHKKTPSSAPPQQILATTVDVREEKSASCFGGMFGRKKHIVHQRPQKDVDMESRDSHFIKQGGGGAVPGIDAPKSAVNSGERRICVESGRNAMQFPIAATTTVTELIQSAANCLSGPIDVRTAVLMEVYTKVGVQRPLRRYEHIRDVMNSWDSDDQNSLFVVSPQESDIDPALLVASNAPVLQPQKSSFVLYYSQKVGKWDRRHVVVREDGQVVAKKNSTAPDRDGTNICHLSDFDIYTPTLKQAAKKIKPPKKLCFAIKSQQKPSMFESTHDFVHFFCTDKRDDASGFFTAVQRWRSYYLYTVKGEGSKKADPNAPAERTVERSRTVKKTPYASPAMSQPASQFPPSSSLPRTSPDKELFTSSGRENENPMARHQSTNKRPATSHARAPQLGDNEPLANMLDRRRSVDSPRASKTFVENGLPGRTYSQAQRDHNGRHSNGLHSGQASPMLPNNSNPIRRDPSVRYSGQQTEQVLSPDMRRAPSTRVRSGESIDLQRNPSQRVPAKPLVDLTPTYREPPQHSRKGRGYNPSSVGPGGLIDSATSPEDALNIPPATAWRGRNSGRSASAEYAEHRDGRDESQSRSRSRANTAHASVSHTRSHTSGSAGMTSHRERYEQQQQRPTTADPLRESAAGFVPGGLLDQALDGWGDNSTGRGRGASSAAVAGGGVHKPLVDLGVGEVYAKGSLLDRQARAEAGP